MSGRHRRGFHSKTGFGSPAKESSHGIHPTILKQARKSGQLNLSNRGLTTVPDSVWRINLDVPEEAKNVSLDNSEDRWWEQVDLTKLILASNALCELSEEIRNLPALTVLDVHDNRLTSLPQAVGDLVNIQRLNLSHNELTSIPECLGNLANLVSLHVEYNKLTQLGDFISGLNHLEDLDVSHNELTSLPRGIGFLTRLFKFNASNNKIGELPGEIGCLNSLRTLDMTHNQLNRLPEEVGQLGHLEQLYLRHNSLTHLPLLPACHALKELHVGNNSIKGLTKEHLESLSALSVLDIRDNKIATLPDEITLMQGLERLDLTNNDLSGLPYALGTLPNLKSVVLDGNPMKSIRRDIIMRGTNELKKYLRSRMEEPTTPPPGGSAGSPVRKTAGNSGIIGGGGDKLDAHTVSSTRSLDYSGKKASDIPDDVFSLVMDAKVETVNFSKNMLSKWPSNLVLMVESLQELNLSFNKLVVLPSDAGLFLRLTCLDLRNNLLSDLPAEMSSLQNLREIFLNFNRLKQIPQVVYEMKKLENLLASDNQINNIDAAALQTLPQLASLDLQNNDIMQVPPELGNVTWLRSLLLGGNPFRQPRPAILTKGTPALLEYLRDRIQIA